MLSYLLFVFSSARADVENVVIKWNAALCLDVCIPLLERNLRGIKGVVDFSINPSAGAAEIQWDPNIPFSYYPFNTASRATGLRLSDIRVRVRGTVSHDSSNFYLISLGDGVQFQLVGPTQAQIGYAITANIATHPLPAYRKDQLLDAENRRQIITVEGPLFEPNRYSLVLIAEQVAIPPPKALQTNYYLR
jgi:hypothetical protein